MKRKIIEIQTSKCNGCGKCIADCPEGALQIIDGKARLVSELFCDGLGACIGNCPAGAIQVVEREAEPYDEKKVISSVIKHGNNTIAAHLRHLLEHGEKELYNTAVEFLQSRNIPLPSPDAASNFRDCHKHSNKQWPIQLKLINPESSIFDNADLLFSADCVAHVCKNFHKKLHNGKVLIILCPKLDNAMEMYVEKISRIFSLHNISSVTVARMTVPCCGSTVTMVQKALADAGKNMDIEVKTINTDGTMV